MPNCELVTVNDPIALFQRLKEQKFTLVIVDPVVQWAKFWPLLNLVLESAAQAAVVVHTSRDAADDAANAVRRGAAHYVVKSPKGLLQLSETLSQHAQTSEPVPQAQPSLDPLTVIRHDMTEPLRSILTSFELIRSQQRGEMEESVAMLMTTAEVTARELLARIDGQFQHIAGRDLLHEYEGGAPLDTTCEASVVLTLALTTLGDLVTRTNATIQHGPLPVVGIGPHDLHLVFQILISNALYYSGRPDPVVIIEAEETDSGMVRFSITDNGPGIPEDEMEDVFSPFFRGASSTGVVGSGIGLNTCRDTLQRFDGKIWVATDRETGCRMYFETLGEKPLV